MNLRDIPDEEFFNEADRRYRLEGITQQIKGLQEYIDKRTKELNDLKDQLARLRDA